MMHKKHEFDDCAQNYRENLDKNLWLSGESSTFFAEYKALKLKEWLPHLVDQPISILDFGCGDGVMTSFVQHLFINAHVHGVDPSRECIEVAQMAYDTIQFRVSDDTIPADNNQFDLVFAAGSFHHIPFQEHDHYLQEISRVLKPGGAFVLFELNPYSPLGRYTFNHTPVECNSTLMKPGYSKKILNRYYSAIVTNYYCFFPPVLHRLRIFEPYMTKLPFGSLYACITQKRA